MRDSAEYGYLQFTEPVPIKNEYADRWLAFYEGRWRLVHILVSGLYIVCRGERIVISIDGV